MMDPKNIARRGMYNLYADEKLDKLITTTVPLGNWGRFNTFVADVARKRKKASGGRMRDHQRVVARQLLQAMRRRSAPKVLFEVLGFERKAA